MENLVETQRKERKTFDDTIKQMTRTNEQAANDSKNAAADARRAAEASEKILKKVNN